MQDIINNQGYRILISQNRNGLEYVDTVFQTIKGSDFANILLPE